MNFKSLIKLFVIWQIFLILVTAASLVLIPLRENYLGGATQAYVQNPLLYSRANFDGVHYLAIANNGYGYAQQAFFPLYPQLIRFFSKTASPVLVGSVISVVSFLIGLYFFIRLLKLDYSNSVIFWTLLALLLFPTSFFFNSVYTEGIFFLLVIASYYYARTGKWWLAGILGALAAYTRLVGIFLFPALLLEAWTQTRSPSFDIDRYLPKAVPLLLIPLGLLVYMIYLDNTVGDPLAFFHVQKLFNQGRSDKIILLYQVFWRYVKMVFTVNRSDPLYLTILLELFSAIIFSFTSIYSLIRHRISYSLFNLASFILPTLTGTFTSLPRYVLLCFPSFLILGQILDKSSGKKKVIYLTISSLLLILYTMLFSRGYWVS